MRKPYDLHTHTVFSDGRSPMEDNLRAAVACGLVHVAVSDHFFGAATVFESQKRNPSWIADYVAEHRRLKAAYPEINFLLAFEAQALDAQGRFALGEEDRKLVDLVLFDMGGATEGIFRNPPGDARTLLQRVETLMLRCCDNPLIDIFAHPFNLGRLPSPVDLDAIPRPLLKNVAQAMKSRGKVFEIMDTMWWWFPGEPIKAFHRKYAALLEVFAGEGVLFSLGSDAHSCCAVGNTLWCDGMIRDLGLGEERFVDPVVFTKCQ